ncbi:MULTISPECIES: SGNH/GDSL hydrolase family protein [Helcococcus]|uniref:SGNH/GDSL hydrolase family protein n=1 Tax=Helcococcus bovis TaxID=3153252 RepID=A0ABW9F4Q3_9FIRM
MKKITLIGDSITEYNYRAAKNWAMWLEESCDYEIQNLGISGTGFYVTSPYIQRISKIDEDTDIIGVAISFNDLNHEITLPTGSYKDKSENTLCGCANIFFEELINKFPNTPIIVYSQGPWEKYRCGVKESDEYLENISKICSNYGLPFYPELYTKGSVLRPWIEENRKKYFTSDNYDLGDYGVVDNIHPNSLGHKVIYKYLKSLFEINIS